MLALMLLAAAPAIDAPAPSDPDKVVRCVRQAETGRLTAPKRVCRTVAEWREFYRDSNDEARRVTKTEGQ